MDLLPYSSHISTTFNCCYSITKSFLTFCDPVVCSRPGFPVLHCLPDFAQTQVQWVSHAIQPSHPLSPCSTPALNLSHHQGFSNELALHIRWAKYWSFNLNISSSSEHSVLISIRVGWLDLLVLQGLCRVFSGTKIQKHQFFGSQLSLWSNSHTHMVQVKCSVMSNS